jgi:hypothetical protein
LPELKNAENFSGRGNEPLSLEAARVARFGEVDQRIRECARPEGLTLRLPRRRPRSRVHAELGYHSDDLAKAFDDDIL